VYPPRRIFFTGSVLPFLPPSPPQCSVGTISTTSYKAVSPLPGSKSIFLAAERILFVIGRDLFTPKGRISVAKGGIFAVEIPPFITKGRISVTKGGIFAVEIPPFIAKGGIFTVKKRTPVPGIPSAGLGSPRAHSKGPQKIA
jgi:hypothetical protein